jgi:aryl-alcohol dehydrogenase-like predicted oxidoreductase
MNMEFGRIEGVSRPVSRVIQGTLGLGRLTDDAAFALLDAIYAEGARAFDTAPVYWAGRAEALLGAWLKARGVRDSVVIIDKGAHPSPERQRVTPEDIALDVARSYAALDAGSIDLYLLHRDDPRVPVGEIIDALNEQRRSGAVAAFGASNWTHARIEAANRYAEQRGLTGFVASSPELNLLEPARTWPGCLSIGGPSGAAARAWYRQTQFPVLAWSPVAGGFLAGTFSAATCAEPETPQRCRVVEFYGTRENLERLERLRELSAAQGIPIAQAAVGYIASQSLNLFVTGGADSASEFRECVDGLRLRFDDADRSWLEDGGARQHSR